MKGSEIVVYCSKCGTQNKEGNKFCKSCGEPIKAKDLKKEAVGESEKENVEKEIIKDNSLNSKKTERVSYKKETSEKIKNKKDKSEENSKKVKEVKESDIKEKLLEDTKDEIAREIKDELKEELKEEISKEIKDEVSEEIKLEVSKELIDEVSDELKEEVSKEIKDEVSDAIKEEVKDEISKEVKEDVTEDIKSEVRVEVRNELSETMELVGLKPKNTKKSSSPLLIFLMVLALVVGYLYFGYITSPKYIAKEYIESLIDKDYKKIYNSVSISGDTTFINEYYYIELLKENVEKNGSIVDYEIEDVIYSDDRNTSIVSVKVIYETSSGTNEVSMEINFSKGEEKQYYIFDTWNMVNQDQIGISIIENYKIYVPSGSIVTFNDIKLENKYLENTDDEKTDIYKLPQVFEKEVDLKIVLPGDIEVSKKITPSKYYNEYRLAIDENDIDKEELEEFKDEIKDALEEIMDGVQAKKSFDDIKDDFSKENDLSDLEELYDKYINRLNRYNLNLVDFEINNIYLSKIRFNHLYHFVVDVKIEFEWKDSLDGKEKTDFGFYTFYLNYESDSYKLVDVDQLPNIFLAINN